MSVGILIYPNPLPMSRFVLSLLVAAAMSVSATSACGQNVPLPGRMYVKEGLFADGAKVTYAKHLPGPLCANRVPRSSYAPSLEGE